MHKQYLCSGAGPRSQVGCLQGISGVDAGTRCVREDPIQSRLSTSEVAILEFDKRADVVLD